MKQKNRYLKSTLTLSVLVLLSSLLLGCDSNSPQIDTELQAEVDSQDWKSCAVVKRKTVYDAFFQSEDFAERLILAGRVSSVLEDLENSRKEFQETGNLVDIFPLLFFYQTRDSLDLAMRPAIKHKKEYLKLILSEYDAYYQNRIHYDAGKTEALDRQWRVYYDAADKAQIAGIGEWTAEDGVDVLLEGVNAHLIYDLPRAVRFVTKNSDSDKTELAKDFEISSGLYADAEQNAKSDILKIFSNEGQKASAQKLFGNGARYVGYVRSKSWEMGIGNGPLGVLQVQPVFQHESKSRTYFPAELIKRGICR